MSSPDRTRNRTLRQCPGETQCVSFSRSGVCCGSDCGAGALNTFNLSGSIEPDTHNQIDLFRPGRQSVPACPCPCGVLFRLIIVMTRRLCVV